MSNPNEDDPMGNWVQADRSKLLDKQMFEWKLKGANFAEIGRAFNIGKEQVRLRLEKYRELQEKDDR